MSTLKGFDEEEAAALVVEFLQDQADRFTREYAKFFGLRHPLKFRGRYTNFVAPWEDEGPLALTSTFVIDGRGREIKQRQLEARNQPPWVVRRHWSTFLALSLHRIDWDEDPDLQGGVCILEFPDLTPSFFKKELKRFLKVTFGCDRVRYFTGNQAAELVYG
jgi:hypothetical protein